VRRRKSVNQSGLHSLGEQIDAQEPLGTVANEAGLRALGAEMEKAARGGGAGPGTSLRQRLARRRAGKPRWSVRRRIVVVCAALVVLVGAVVGGGYAYVHYQFDQLHKVACHACTQVAAGQPYNLLVIGSDSRAGNTGQAASSFGTYSAVGGQRSDSIKIFHIDPAAGTARVLSIPRDTYVTTSGLAPSTGLTGPEKINAAFNNGPEALVETIQNTFGIPISHWIVIDFDGVIDSVKALGGIELDFRYPVRDDNDGVNESGLDITQTGCQSLTGTQVLALSRSRYYEYYQDGEWQMDPGYDLSRIARQNVIVEAMIAKAKGTFNPFTWQSLIDAVKGNVSIDDKLSLGTVYDVIERYHAFSPSSLQTWTLPTVAQAGTPAGDVELVNTQAPNDYVTTITEFLGAPPGPVSTPPLDRYGYPITVPTPAAVPPASTTTTGAAPHTSTTAPPAPSTPSLPSYDPTVCT
jgi:LCP family protein required for cell wall assembly